MKKLIPSILLVFFALILVMPESQAMLQKKEVKTKSYKEMSKVEKKAFRKDLIANIKAIKKQRKEARKGHHQTAMSGMAYTGLILAGAGLAVAIVAGVLSLGLIAGLGGLLMLIGVIIFVLALLDII